MKFTIFAIYIYLLFSDIFATYLQRANLCKSMFSSGVMNERCIKYPSEDIFSSIEPSYQKILTSRSVFGCEFVFVFFLGRGVKGSGIPDPGPVTDIPIFRPHFHPYLARLREQSLFFLRPWSETREICK